MTSPTFSRRLLLAGATIVLGALFSFERPALAVPAFTLESGIRLATATPQAVVGDYPAVRLYFVRNFQVWSATSADGVTWFEEPGMRVSSNTVNPAAHVFSSVTAAALLPLDTTGYRMLFTVSGGADGFRVLSATSANGLTWGIEVAIPLSVDDGATFVGSPRLVELPNDNWRLYYVQDADGGNDLDDRQIFSILSTDQGESWTAPVNVLDENAYEIGVSTLTNSRIRLYYAAPLTSGATASRVLSALSVDTDGDDFSIEDDVRLSTDPVTGEFSALTLFRTTETFAWRMLLTYRQASTTTVHAFSAVARRPDVQSSIPVQVDFLQTPRTFTIAGEVFSSGPTLELRRTGQTSIPGTSVVRLNDQTITAVFDTTNKALGGWNLHVTNDNGLQDTLIGALSITIPGGSLTLTDNLLRPRLNAPTSIALTFFVEGRITVKIYNLDGRLIKTVVDEQRAAGTHTFTWNATADDGHNVASGTYIIRAEGPELESTQKIVVIR